MTREEIIALTRGFAPAIDAHVKVRIAAAIEPLQRRIQELEARPRGLLYEGVYSEGSAYEKDSAVTFDGSIFVALRRTNARPGASPDWRLAVKRGKDGKDAPR